MYPPTVKIDLNNYLRENDESFKAFLRPAVNMRLSLQAPLAEIEATPEQLQELIMVFLSNAKNAMPQGGQLLLQTREALMPDMDVFRLGPSLPYLMLAMSDSGKGIPPGTQLRIQQLFSNRWKPQEGVFSGLTAAKKILDSLQARFLLYSQMDRGTTMKLYFPLHKKRGPTDVCPARREGNGNTSICGR